MRTPRSAATLFKSEVYERRVVPHNSIVLGIVAASRNTRSSAWATAAALNAFSSAAASMWSWEAEAARTADWLTDLLSHLLADVLAYAIRPGVTNTKLTQVPYRLHRVVFPDQ